MNNVKLEVKNEDLAEIVTALIIAGHKVTRISNWSNDAWIYVEYKD